MTIPITTEGTVTPYGLPRRIPSQYGRPGTMLKVNIKQSLYEALRTAKDSLEYVASYDFSNAILVRRALQLYCSQVARMSTEQLQDEASNLFHNFR